jgi:positive regulator of sigma E activity
MFAGLTVVTAVSDSDLALFVGAFVLGLLIAFILSRLYPRRRRAA